MTPFARADAMLWTSRSEHRLTGLSEREGVILEAVIIDGVWQTELTSASPFRVELDDGPRPGGARNPSGWARATQTRNLQDLTGWRRSGHTAARFQERVRVIDPASRPSRQRPMPR